MWLTIIISEVNAFKNYLKTGINNSKNTGISIEVFMK